MPALTPNTLNGMSLNTVVQHLAAGMEGFSYHDSQLCFMGKPVSVSEDGALQIANDQTPPSSAGKSLLERMISLNPAIGSRIANSFTEAEHRVAHQMVLELGTGALEATNEWSLKKAILMELAETDPFFASRSLWDFQEQEKDDEVKFAFASRLQKHLNEHVHPDRLAFSDPDFAFRLLEEKLENATSHTGFMQRTENLADYGVYVMADPESMDNDRAAYCAKLSKWLDKKAPKYHDAIQPLIDSLNKENTPVSQRDEMMGSRIMYLIAALSSDKATADVQTLTPFIKAIFHTRNRKNLDYLLPGLVELSRSPTNLQQLVSQDRKGGEQFLLSGLSLLSFHPDMINEEQFKTLFTTMHKGGATKRVLKDAKVFTNWMDTLERLKLNKELPPATKYAVLDALLTDPKKLNTNLSALKVLLAGKPDVLNQKVESGEPINFKAELDQIIRDEFGDPANPDQSTPEMEWIHKSKNPHLVPLYLVGLRTCGDSQSARMEQMFRDFVTAAANGNYQTFRHDASENPHLQIVHQRKPELATGVCNKFSTFSENITSRLKNGETIEFTEDAQDLFLSGYDLYTCQSPDGSPRHNKALLSYLVNGHNAMVAIKGNNGQIKARMMVRVLLATPAGYQAYRPVLVCEPPYPVEGSEEFKQLMKDAALEISKQTDLSLMEEDRKLGGRFMVLVETYPGKAPYEYSDLRSGLTEARNSRFNARLVK
ncbi:hypothetical protein [Parendozoicomonas haliclonae]|uniref:Uncharacterized protein n=1 Tax=Parendozoicomonas haliclonae TaxID=1960125 RepID=A0A1X7AGB0_9GAMM|nr:hypothetical protein [Parendozoicomonas haliclonae]SMA39376.1 hypothetical protein EHSB41UT_01024 [Parendozoicomonas haliclonae]